MKQVKIIRDRSTDAGTPGKLVGPFGFECRTIEPPWRDVDRDGKRDRGVSCVKAGTYRCRRTVSSTRKNKDGTPESSYELQEVPDASGVRMHRGNFAGDKSKGYLSDSEACVLLGRALMDVEIPKERRVPGGAIRQLGVTSSGDTIAAFEAHMELGQFDLTIEWAPGAAPEEAA